MTQTGVEHIFDEYRMLAIIVHSEYSQEGIEFFTPTNFSQQLAFMCRPAGYRIPAHIHKPTPRSVQYTQETLFIRKGRLRVAFFSESHQYLFARELKTGDVLLLISGGHEFEMLEESEIIEVKQGPYTGDDDKEIFEVKQQ
jgi:mannose-6-phosphate isomerase-like protein (cupin superfamily)